VSYETVKCTEASCGNFSLAVPCTNVEVREFRRKLHAQQETLNKSSCRNVLCNVAFEESETENLE